MTRDEFERHWTLVVQAKRYLDLFVDAGMPELDELPSIEARAVRALWDKLEGPTSPGRVLGWLDEAGLKIVEK